MTISEIAEMLMQISAEFNIDLNAKNSYERTAFHNACMYNRIHVGPSKTTLLVIYDMKPPT